MTLFYALLNFAIGAGTMYLIMRKRVSKAVKDAKEAIGEARETVRATLADLEVAQTLVKRVQDGQ